MGEPARVIVEEGDDAEEQRRLAERHEAFYSAAIEWASAQDTAVPWNPWQQEMAKLAVASDPIPMWLPSS